MTKRSWERDWIVIKCDDLKRFGGSVYLQKYKLISYDIILLIRTKVAIFRLKAKRFSRTISRSIRPDRSALKAPGRARKYFNPRSGEFCLSTPQPLSCRDKHRVWCNSRCLLSQRLMTLIRVNKVSL